MHGSQNPYLFVVGCPRSGTTLLRRMLFAHSALVITPETHWIPRCYLQRTGLDDDDRINTRLRDYLYSYEKFSNFRIPRHVTDALFERRPRLTYDKFVSELFDLYGATKNKTLVGDKTPGYARHMPLLARLWPQARFLHIVRDGRDVALSVLNWKRSSRNVGRFSTWQDDKISTIALWWESFVTAAQRDGTNLGSKRFLEIRYEDLLAEPLPVCQQLCEFLALDDEAANMVDFHRGKTRKSSSGLSAKKAWLPLTPGLRNWRSELPSDEIAKFEALCGDLLSRCGYDRHIDSIDRAALDHAERFRRRFAADPHDGSSWWLTKPGAKVS